MRTAGIVSAFSLLLVTACSSTPDADDQQPESTPDTEAAQPEPPTPDLPDAQEEGDFLDQEVKRLSLQEQKKRFMVDSYIHDAIALRDRLHLAEGIDHLGGMLAKYR